MHQGNFIEGALPGSFACGQAVTLGMVANLFDLQHQDRL